MPNDWYAALCGLIEDYLTLYKVHNALNMKEEKLTNKPSEPDKADAYIKSIEHPLGNIVEALRHIVWRM
jgi:hypothetical protein